jgi:hypothetical protein
VDAVRTQFVGQVTWRGWLRSNVRRIASMEVTWKQITVDLGLKFNVVVSYMASDATPYRAPGKQQLVLWPPGVVPAMQSRVEDALHLKHDQVVYVNDPSDLLTLEGKQPIHPSEKTKADQARRLVITFLKGEPLLSGQQTLTIEQQKVVFCSGNLSEWAGILAKADAEARGHPDQVDAVTTTDEKKAEKVEGITFGGPVGKRVVYLNNVGGHRWYTAGTIVHELFHTIESEQLKTPVGQDEKDNPIQMSGPQVEAVTEYFARRAAGLDVRVGVGQADCYYEEMKPLTAALTKALVDDTTLVNAYFLGDKEAIKVVSKVVHD